MNDIRNLDALARISKLETRCRRMELSGIALLTLIILVALANRIVTPNVLRAREFALRDDSGKTVARLSIRSSASCLELGNGTATGAMLCDDGDEGSLLLTNGDAQARALLSAGVKLREAPGSLPPGLMISERDGQSAASITVHDGARLALDGPSSINSMRLSSDEKGNLRAPLRNHTLRKLP